MPEGWRTLLGVHELKAEEAACMCPPIEDSEPFSKLSHHQAAQIWRTTATAEGVSKAAVMPGAAWTEACWCCLKM